jgi:hypothetical protein
MFVTKKQLSRRALGHDDLAVFGDSDRAFAL